jgi:hypothetical protein
LRWRGGSAQNVFADAADAEQTRADVSAEHGTDLRDEGGLAAKDLTAVVDQAGGARASLLWNA